MLHQSTIIFLGLSRIHSVYNRCGENASDIQYDVTSFREVVSNLTLTYLSLCPRIIADANTLIETLIFIQFVFPFFIPKQVNIMYRTIWYYCMIISVTGVSFLLHWYKNVLLIMDGQINLCPSSMRRFCIRQIGYQEILFQQH